MTAMRPVAVIRHLLDTARASNEHQDPSLAGDELIDLMHQANDREIAALERELATALSSDLEVSLEGQPVDDHRVSVPYFNRILEQLQAAFRSIRRASLSLGESLPRRESTLLLSGTAPGSFKAFLRAPTMQLDLLTAPEADVALLEIVNLFTSAQEGDIDRAVDWAERAPEPAVRSMIRLASTLAAGRGTTRFRLTSADQQHEHLISVTADNARDLAAALAGQTGREVVYVTGHLEMGQDSPPRARIVTSTDEYLAAVAPELLDRVKELLFLEVTATLSVEMRTSLATGIPSTVTELLDLDLA